MIENAIALIAQTPAARPSMPSEKFTTFITKTRPSTVSGAPASPRSTAPRNGSVMFVTSTPGRRRGSPRRRSGRPSLTGGRRSKRSSSAPTSAISAPPARIALHALADVAVEVQEQRARGEHAGEDRQAAEQRRVARRQTALARAVDGADARRRSRAASGVSSAASANADGEAEDRVALVHPRGA